MKMIKFIVFLFLSFFTVSRLDGTSAYNFRKEKKLMKWDDGSTIFWDNGTPILWGG